MKIKATFNGLDNSLKYRNGGLYLLEMSEINHPDGRQQFSIKPIAYLNKESRPNEMGEPLVCVYDSLDAFVENWTTRPVTMVNHLANHPKDEMTRIVSIKYADPDKPQNIVQIGADQWADILAYELLFNGHANDEMVQFYIKCKTKEIDRPISFLEKEKCVSVVKQFANDIYIWDKMIERRPSINSSQYEFVAVDIKTGQSLRMSILLGVFGQIEKIKE